jgi:hypothetical protein
MKRRLHSARAKEQRPNVHATRPPLAPVARQSLLALSRPKTRGQTGWMCAATRAGLLPVPRREQQAPTSSNGKPSGLPLWGCWGLTRSLYGYSMSNRIKLNPLARGPDPRFVPKRGPGNLRPRRPCVQLHTSLFRRRSPVQAGRWRRLGYRKLGSGSRVHVSVARPCAWPVDLRQLVLSLLLRTPHRASVALFLFSLSLETRRKGESAADDSYLVDPASSHMLVSKIKPCMSKCKSVYTVKLRMAH